MLSIQAHQDASPLPYPLDVLSYYGDMSLPHLQAQHQLEARLAHGLTEFREGSLPGDVVAIVHPGPQDMSATKAYLYRRNPETGNYTFVKLT